MMAASLSSSFVFYQSFYDMIALIPELETQLAAYGVICVCALNGMEPQTVTPFAEQEEGREWDIPYSVSYAVEAGPIFCAHAFCDGLSFPLDFSSFER